MAAAQFDNAEERILKSERPEGSVAVSICATDRHSQLGFANVLQDTSMQTYLTGIDGASDVESLIVAKVLSECNNLNRKLMNNTVVAEAVSAPTSSYS